MFLSIIDLLSTVVGLYTWILIARIILSWFPLPSGPTLQKIWDFIFTMTEPFLSIFRRFIPPLMAGGVGIDLSPIFAILTLTLGWDIIRSILISIVGSI